QRIAGSLMAMVFFQTGDDMAFRRVDLVGGDDLIVAAIVLIILIGAIYVYGGKKTAAVLCDILARIGREMAEVECCLRQPAHAAQPRAKAGDKAGGDQRQALDYFNAVTLFYSKMIHWQTPG